MAEALEETVREAIAKVKHVSPERVLLDTSLAELGLDSLDRVTLLFELEDRLQIAIPDEAAARVRSVRDVVEGMRSLRAANG